jgi:hypothetical protein
MKSIIKTFFLATIFLSFNSCKNDLVLIENWKDIPIVYGVIAISDTATYIRVEKAFVDPNKSALDLAQIADSLYYPDITVQLVKNKSTTYNLTRVDGNLEGYKRTTGIFANTPNYLYKINNATLRPAIGDLLQLVVKKKDGKILTTGNTAVIGVYERNFSAPTMDIPYVNVDSVNSTLTIGFRSDEVVAVFYEVNVYINYEETDAIGTKQKQLLWKFDPSLLRKNTTGIAGMPDLPSETKRKSFDMFKFLANSITPNASTIRKFKTFDIEITAGGPELYNYINLGSVNTGITGGQPLPNATTLTNGYGLFSSKYRLYTPGYKISETAQTLLQNGPLTRNLNFR